MASPAAGAAASGSVGPWASGDARSLARATWTPHRRPRRYGNQSQGWHRLGSPGWGTDRAATLIHLREATPHTHHIVSQSFNLRR